MAERYGMAWHDVTLGKMIAFLKLKYGFVRGDFPAFRQEPYCTASEIMTEFFAWRIRTSPFPGGDCGT